MRSPRHSSLLSKVGMGFLTTVGVVAFAYYVSWWFAGSRWQSPWLLLGLAAALAFSHFQIFSHWLFFLCAELKPHRRFSSPGKHSVDVLVTVCGEDHVLVRRCVAAACAMRGKHRVWLLDDGPDPALRQLAHDLGTGYLTRGSREDAKAGNLNNAFAQTGGDILVIFDVDHVPLPGFLEATLGYFDDPQVGFVQVMLTFHEDRDNWVELAAVQSSFGFYNPTSTGMDRLGSVTMMGSNSLIRREALESIGNYQPGLAEDLATSLALHRGGWRSVYVAEPLAPGLAPPDLLAWFTQQFKWSRGVFEVLLADYLPTWWKLTWQDRLAYGVRTTMYWLGPALCVHILATILVLLWGNAQTVMDYEQYLLHLMPLAICNTIIHGVALKRWLHPSLQAHAMWKAVVLVFATWPVYTLAWLMAVLRIPLAFRPTPKTSSGNFSPWWLIPQFTVTVLLISTALSHLARHDSYVSAVVVAAALALAAPQILFFWMMAAATERRAEAKLGDTI